MVKVLEFLKGKKTYFCAAAAGILQTAVFLGYATQEQVNPLLVMLGVGGVASIRAAIK